MTNDYKVRLSDGRSEVVFQASAPVNESRRANYQGFDIVHSPVDIQAYRNTNSRRFGVQAKLVSRNEDEAEANARYLNLIRAWMLPDFGASGATPPVLFFNAYYNDNLADLKVVIESMTWVFGDEVDYIFTGLNPMPVIGALSIELLEVYSAEEVTAKAWKIRNAELTGGFVIGDINLNGTFSTALTVTPTISDLTQGFSGIASGDFGLPGVGNILSQAAGGFVPSLPSFGEALGIEGSPLVSDVVSQVSEVTGNVFSSGVAALTDTVSTLVPSAPQQLADISDSFARSAGLALPSFIRS